MIANPRRARIDAESTGDYVGEASFPLDSGNAQERLNPEKSRRIATQLAITVCFLDRFVFEVP